VKPVVTVSQDIGATAGKLLADALNHAKSVRGRAVLAVPGGGSPAPVFRWLAEHYDGTDTVLTWVDERHLPLPETGDWRDLPGSSNLRGAWENWLSRTQRPPKLIPLARAGTLSVACQAVRADLDALGGLDVVLLGAGPDGHIASLFPGHSALGSRATCIAIRDSPKPPPERLTLSLPVLENADRVVLVASGSNKAGMLKSALAGDPSLPLSRLRPRADWHWVLDPAAASLLESL
jgi:6-phosphogluconolactonase